MSCKAASLFSGISMDLTGNLCRPDTAARPVFPGCPASDDCPNSFCFANWKTHQTLLSSLIGSPISFHVAASLIPIFQKSLTFPHISPRRKTLPTELTFCYTIFILKKEAPVPWRLKKYAAIRTNVLARILGVPITEDAVIVWLTIRKTVVFPFACGILSNHPKKWQPSSAPA